MGIGNDKHIDDEGDNMMALKENTLMKNTEVKYVPAKDSDVIKAIMKSNKKHTKMLSMLAK